MRCTPLIIVCLTSALFAQQTEQTPEFEAVSVKLWDGSPHGPDIGNSDGGPGTRHPEVYSTNSTIRWLISRAWGLTDSGKQISGPSWIDGQQFAVDAKLPPGATKEQFQKMLQKMLADRFGLVAHQTTTTVQVLELTIGKSGSKLQPAGSIPAAEVVSDGSDKDGYPVLSKPGIVSRLGPGLAVHLTAREQTIDALAKMLSLPGAAGRTVIDKTGLTDKYDFNLHYDFDAPGSPAELALSVFDAVQQQLGLKLVEAKEPFDLIVIDHVEKAPTAN